jgi:plasmid stabilization system protein ParE
VANVAFLPAAEADYQEALAWYQARSPQAAAGFEAAVEVALRAIGHAPERWTFCDDRHRFYGLRRYPYSIIYRVEAGDILVVTIAHSRRSASYWQSRD